MICGGVPTESINHAENVLNTSMGILMESKFVLNPITHQPIKIRVGVHSGPVVNLKISSLHLKTIGCRRRRSEDAEVWKQFSFIKLNFLLYLQF